MAKLIKPNMEVSDIFPANGKSFTLLELQTIVGGPIELVRLPKKLLMYVNEEGGLLELPINPVATRIAKVPGGFVLGNAIICTKREGG